MKSRTLTQSSLALAIAAAGLAQSAFAGGFVEDSKASLTLRNFYINTDNRNGTAAPSKQEEWGQGFLLNYTSGYTEGTVGVGVDALGLLGVRRGSGRGSARSRSTSHRCGRHATSGSCGWARSCPRRGRSSPSSRSTSRSTT